LKITSFYPVIVSRDPEKTIRIFEELGFEKWQEDGISDQGFTAIRMKDENGFDLDIATGSFPEDCTLIRMCVDDPQEAIDILTARGFTKVDGVGETTDTPSSGSSILVSSSGLMINVIRQSKA